MKPRERVIRAIEREGPDRVPLSGAFLPEVWEKLYGFFGSRDDDVVLDKLGIDDRHLGFWPGEPSDDFKRRATDISKQTNYKIRLPRWAILHPGGILEDDWGIKYKVGATGRYWHFAYHPLQDAESVDEYEFPDMDAPGRFDEAEKHARKYRDEYFMGAGVAGFIERARDLMGFTKFVRDLYTNPKFVDDLLDKLLDVYLKQGKRYIELGADCLGSSEDAGMQTQMWISPHLWRRFIKPRLRNWIRGLKKAGDVYISIHSDGHIKPIIPDLIEIGTDILNPVQPDCMDPAEIKREYGDKLTLSGTISVQETLPFGTVEDVKREVITRIKTVGYDGGLILGPTHVVDIDVPLENILSMYETAKKHGQYR